MGVTWEYLDNCMTVPRLKAFYKAWETDPPLPLAFARFIGIAPKKRRRFADDVHELTTLGIPAVKSKDPPPGFFIVGEDGKPKRAA